jgi:hypothetical protein
MESKNQPRFHDPRRTTDRRSILQGILMEPISSLVVGYAAGKFAQIAETAIRSNVLERWVRHRAKEFFEAFCKAVADENTTESELRQKLDELLTDDKRSEVVFDAYRAVCLSKSKTIGPRVIALLTAELVNSGALADDEEVALYGAAEELSDSELRELADFTIGYRDRATLEGTNACSIGQDGSICVRLDEASFDSNWNRESEVSVAPLDLANSVGCWAAKLKRHGLVSDDVKERQWSYPEDSERHVDQPGIAREVTWWANLSPSCVRLALLIKTASGLDAAS